MTNLDKIPPRIPKNLVDTLIENTWSIKTESDARATMQHMSANELFEMWLNWNGIIGYTETIIEAIDSIRAANS